MKELIFLTGIHFAGYLLSMAGQDFFAGLVLFAGSLLLAWHRFRKTGFLLDPPALIFLFFSGGEGISLFKLSRLQTVWAGRTHLCLYLACGCFFVAYSLVSAAGEGTLRVRIRTAGMRPAGTEVCTGAGVAFLPTEQTAALTGACKAAGSDRQIRRLLLLIYAVTALSVVSLLAEAAILSYIPLFTTDTPHAYSYFHISGVHYFTVVCSLVPPLFTLLVCCGGDRLKQRNMRGRVLAAAVCTAVSLVIPLLLVSRFQLIYGVVLSFLTAAAVRTGQGKRIHVRKKTIFLIGGSFLLLVLLYLFLSVERAHSAAYLLDIFEMKDSRMPVWAAQPYIYVANNYDNFNCLVEGLKEHTYGLKQLFPVFALTGLKFLHPELVAFPLYIDKEELTTLTLIYDAYYDFGTAGVMGFMLLLGSVSALAVYLLKNGNDKNKRLFSKKEGSAEERNRIYGLIRSAAGSPVRYMIYGQLCFYLMFSFFTTWFSNPTVWFYLGISLIMCVISGDELPSQPEAAKAQTERAE